MFTTSETAEPKPATELTQRRWLPLLKYVLIFAVLFLAVIGLQWHAGAYSAEFSGYPDEPSHYLSGRLVHHYITAGFPQSPIRFAEQFYVHYPYLAIGHWPPGFYAVEGFWMLLFSPSRISIILLMGLITATLAFSTYLVISRARTATSGAISALFLISMPVVQSYAGMVMADILLAVLSFWAVIAFGEYARTGRARFAAWFAILSAAAIITKANGFLLAGVPILTILLSRRFALLKRRSLWLSGAFVAAMCLPWHFASMHMMLPTFTSTAGLAFMMQSSALYGALLLRSLGAMGAGLCIAGIIAALVRPGLKGALDPRWAAQGALWLSYFIFYCGIPAGIESRYLILLLPSGLLLVNAGAEMISRFVCVSTSFTSAQPAVLAIAALVLFFFSFSLPRKVSYGFERAADAIASRYSSMAGASLVSSETPVGEGIFVSEMAMRSTPEMSSTVLRASKVLAEEDWNRTRYIPVYSSAEQLRVCLKEANLEYLVLDTSSSSKGYQHHRQLIEVVRNHPEEWRLIGSYSANGQAPVELFQRTSQRDQLALGSRITTNLDGKFGTWPVIMRLPCSAEAAAGVH